MSHNPGSKAYYQDRCARLEAQLKDAHGQLLNREAVAPLDVSNTTRIGYLAEQYVRYRVARVGLQFFVPETQSAACDLLIQGPSGKFYRCEVKATGRGSLVKLYTTRYDKSTGKNVRYLYEDRDGIDFFVLVDLTSEAVFVVPFAEYKGRAEVSLEPGCATWAYKDRFDYFV